MFIVVVMTVYNISRSMALQLEWQRLGGQTLRVICRVYRENCTGFVPIAMQSPFWVSLVLLLEALLFLGIFYRLLALNFHSLRYKSICATFSFRRFVSIVHSGWPVVRLTSWQSLCTVLQFLQLGFVGIVILNPATDAELAWLIPRLVYLLLAERMASNPQSKPRRVPKESKIGEEAVAAAPVPAGRQDSTEAENLKRGAATVGNFARIPVLRKADGRVLGRIACNVVPSALSGCCFVSVFTPAEVYFHPDLYSGEDTVFLGGNHVSSAVRPGSPARQGARHE